MRLGSLHSCTPQSEALGLNTAVLLDAQLTHLVGSITECVTEAGLTWVDAERTSKPEVANRQFGGRKQF